MGKELSGYTSRGDGEYTDDSEAEEIQESAENLVPKLENLSIVPDEPLYKQVTRYISAFGWIYYHNEEDVRKFFEGLKIRRLFMHDFDGFFNFICYIEFENSDEADKALTKDQDLVEERIIHIEKLTASKLRSLLKVAEENQKYSNDGFIMLQGLTGDSNEAMIHEFLPGINIQEIVFGDKAKKYQPRQAFLKLASKEEELKVLDMFGEKRRGFIGRHYIKILTLTGAGFYKKKTDMLNPRRANPDMPGPSNQRKQFRSKATITPNSFLSDNSHLRRKVNQLENTNRQLNFQLYQANLEISRLKNELNHFRFNPRF